MTVVGSLCSGYGGLDLGLALALGAIEVAWHVEYDKHPSAILDHHWPGVPNYGDLTSLDYDVMRRVDWLTAGYPCQPSSYAGKRKGSADERHLWPFVAGAISALRPPNVLLENVRGHVSLGLDAVLADLAGLGYDARWGVVRASDAGAPHGRARVFIVATDAQRISKPGRGAVRDVGGSPSGGADQGIQRQWNRDAAYDRGPVATNGQPRDGWAGPAECGHPATDTSSHGWDEGRTEPAGIIGGPDAAERGLPTTPNANHADRRCRNKGRGPLGRDAAARRGEGGVEWGAYAPAIRRWETVLRRPAPRPTEPGRNGQRLSPAFVEWMMGLPPGWVTDVPGLARNAQLKALGNGVVPQQAALALRMLGVTQQAVA